VIQPICTTGPFLHSESAGGGGAAESRADSAAETEENRWWETAADGPFGIWFIAVVSTDAAVKLSTTYQQVCESCHQLEQLLAALRSERKRAEEEQRREEGLLKDCRESEVALEKKLAAAQSRTGRGRTNNAEAELRERVSLAEESIETLRENLVRFTADEILQPSEEVEGGGEGERRRKRRGTQARVDTMLRGNQGTGKDGERFPSLADVLQVYIDPLYEIIYHCGLQDLISKTLSSPHAPYLPLSSIWPPHVNLLMRSGVTQRNPDNPGLVRVTPFHL
jgi:hypothetical protein